MTKWWIFSNVVMGKTNRLNIFLPMYCIVHLLGNLTPIRSGEMSGPLFLRKYIQLPYSDGIALIVLETALEAFVFGIGFLFAIIYFGLNFLSYSELSEAVIKWACLAVLIVMLCTYIIRFILLRPLQRKGGTKLIVSSYLTKIRFLERIKQVIRKISQAFWLFGKNRIIAYSILLTILAWILGILRVYPMLSAVGNFELLDVSASFVVVAAFSMITLIPLGIGVAKMGWIVVLESLGYEQSLVVAGMLLERTLSLFLLIVISSLSMYRLSYRVPKKGRNC
jgi:uncharacterized protein (TIRG00374 family)